MAGVDLKNHRISEPTSWDEANARRDELNTEKRELHLRLSDPAIEASMSFGEYAKWRHPILVSLRMIDEELTVIRRWLRENPPARLPRDKKPTAVGSKWMKDPMIDRAYALATDIKILARSALNADERTVVIRALRDYLHADEHCPLALETSQDRDIAKSLVDRLSEANAAEPI